MRIRSEDEVGQLAKRFKALSENLLTLIRNVQNQSEQVAASSEQLTSIAAESSKVAESVAGTSMEMAAGASKQVAAVNDAAAITEELVLGYKCGHKNVESVKLKARKDVSNIEQTVYR